MEISGQSIHVLAYFWSVEGCEEQVRIPNEHRKNMQKFKLAET